MISAQCRTCKAIKELDVTEEQLQAWRAGTLIQQAMPNLSADDRELLISGVCGKCFDAMFEGDEDE